MMSMLRLLAVAEQSFALVLPMPSLGRHLGIFRMPWKQLPPPPASVVRSLLATDRTANARAGAELWSARLGPQLRSGMTLAIEPMVNKAAPQWKCWTTDDCGHSIGSLRRILSIRWR